MRFIFNEQLLKSVICGTWEQCTGALFTVNKLNVAAEKKKKRTNADVDFNSVQMGTKPHT